MGVGAEHVALRFGARANAGDEKPMDGQRGECERREVLTCDVNVGEKGEQGDFLLLPQPHIPSRQIEPLTSMLVYFTILLRYSITLIPGAAREWNLVRASGVRTT